MSATISLVIGQGSIGQRHARILQKMGYDVVVHSRRISKDYPTTQSLEEGLEKFKPNYIIIANETIDHFATIKKLIDLDYQGKLLIEKPLSCQAETLPPHSFERVALGYNLRFHPLVQKLKQKLEQTSLLNLQIYCGQYLPDWRPNTNHLVGYSAHKERGGGVLRDLSHELDMLLWLGGDWKRLSAIGGKTSNITIDSDDNWAILAEMHHCSIASLQINYFDRPGRRNIIVHTAQDTYSLDFSQGILWHNGTPDYCNIERDTTYLAQHQAMLEESFNPNLCGLEQGKAIMELIAATEQASHSQQWISAKDFSDEKSF